MFLANTSKVTINGQFVGSFQNVLTHENVLSRANFFKSDIAIPCRKINYEVSENAVQSPNPDVIF
jgi:hypothetical protein